MKAITIALILSIAIMIALIAIPSPTPFAPEKELRRPVGSKRLDRLDRLGKDGIVWNRMEKEYKKISTGYKWVLRCNC
jgi:hypothetical protein